MIEQTGTIEADGRHYDVLQFTSAPPAPRPNGHLSVLRNPRHHLRHCDTYLSPGLHNISPTYVRQLERNVRSLAEADNAWAEFLSYSAPVFTLCGARKSAQRKVSKATPSSKVCENLLISEKQEMENILRGKKSMNAAAERGDSYKYVPDYDGIDDDDDDSDDSDDDDEDFYDHLYAVDSRSSSTHTPSSTPGNSPTLKSSTGFYNMSRFTTSDLALSADDRSEGPCTNLSNDREHNTPAQPCHLRGVVDSSADFTYSLDRASGFKLDKLKLPLIYPDLPMPPSKATPSLGTLGFPGEHDGNGDLALQAPQFAVALNEEMDRALRDYENTTLSPFKDDWPAPLKLPYPKVRNRTYHIIQGEPEEQGEVSEPIFLMSPTHLRIVTQRELNGGISREIALSAHADLLPRRRRRSRKKESTHEQEETGDSPRKHRRHSRKKEEHTHEQGESGETPRKHRRHSTRDERRHETEQANDSPRSADSNPVSRSLFDRFRNMFVDDRASSTLYSHPNTQFVTRRRRKHRRSSSTV